MKTSLLFLSLCLTITFCKSQSNSEAFFNSSTSVYTLNFRDKSIQGSQYIDENFLIGKLSINDKLYTYRFNAYRDEFEFIMDGKPYYLPKAYNYTLTLSGINKIYKVFQFKKDSQLKDGFFVILATAINYTLLLKEEIKLSNEVVPKSGYEKYQPPTLKRVKDTFFIGFSDNTAVEIPKKKKEFYSLFNGQSKKVEAFVKSNKLSIKKKEDLLLLFKYLQSLN